jgi:hypothetical protein
MKLLILFIVGMALVGCKPQPRSKRIVDQFKFLQLWMSVNDVTNRLGQPDRGYRGQYRLRYDLADGTEMVIAANYVEEYAPDVQRVYWFGQSRDGNWLWTKQTAGDLTHYLQWTQGTPVTLHMLRAETASAILVNVSHDAILVGGSGTNTFRYDKDSILWVERNPR